PAQDDPHMFLEGRTTRKALSEGQLPRLADQIVAEAVVRLLGDEGEPLLLINMPRFGEHTVCPEHKFPVAATPRETNALLDEPGAQSQAARLRLDQQQAELGNCLAGLHDEHRADDLAVHLCDPATLARRVIRVDKICDDLGYQRFETLVPAVF